MSKGKEVISKLMNHSDNIKENMDRISRENKQVATDDQVNKVRVETCYKHTILMPKMEELGIHDTEGCKIFDYSHFGQGIISAQIGVDSGLGDYLKVFHINSISEYKNAKVDDDAVFATYLFIRAPHDDLVEYLYKGRLISSEQLQQMAKEGNFYAFSGMTDTNGKYIENTAIVLSKETADDTRNIDIMESKVYETLERFQIEVEKEEASKLESENSMSSKLDAINSAEIIPQETTPEE